MIPVPTMLSMFWVVRPPVAAGDASSTSSSRPRLCCCICDKVPYFLFAYQDKLQSDAKGKQIGHKFVCLCHDIISPCVLCKPKRWDGAGRSDDKYLRLTAASCRSGSVLTNQLIGEAPMRRFQLRANFLTCGPWWVLKFHWRVWTGTDGWTVLVTQLIEEEK